jgi:DNA-binding NarL/FixJ family response regulator
MKLTPRRKQVADFVLSGYGPKEISKELKISEVTVKRHLEKVYLLFGITDGVKRVKLARMLWTATAAERSQSKSNESPN